MFNTLPPPVKPALIVFSCAALIIISAITFSLMYQDEAYTSEISAQRAMRIWKNKIDGSRESDKIIDKYEQSYLDLVKKGVVGNEDRLSWFETIQYVSEARGMPSVKYSIVSQKKVESSDLKQRFSGLDLYSSMMTLDITMGHEGDLFALINGLQDKAEGLFTVDKCNLEKTKSIDQLYGTVSIDQMKAYCELSWYTIKSADGRG